MIQIIVSSLICLFVVGLIFWISFVAYTENRFFKEQNSIKKWLEFHGFGIIRNHGPVFFSCEISRLGSHKKYRSVKAYMIYWELYLIRYKKKSRDDTVRMINKMISGMYVPYEKPEEKKDFWI